MKSSSSKLRVRSTLVRLRWAGRLGSLLLFASLSAHAGMMSPCQDPIVLPDAQVQVFILPHRAESRLTDQGHQLATIMQRHVLFAALQYRSIAVEELTGQPEQCDFERTAARVIPHLRAGQSVIFLMGRLFEQGESIRLQSTVTFMTPGKPDVFSWNLGANEPTSAIASVPSEPVMFAPRIIPLNFIEMLEPAQREARKLHKAPDANSPFWELPADPDARFGFQVIESKNDWMHVRLVPAGGEGWIPAHALTTGGNLKDTFPELYFINGLIGYLELSSSHSQQALADNHTVLKSTLSSFDQYLELAGGRAESDARTLAAVLQGNATLRAEGKMDWSTEQLQQAQRYFTNAKRLAPTSTVANSFFLACGAALCARGACEEGSDQLHAQFLNAIAQDPTSRELVDNLNAFYGAAQSGRIKVKESPEQISAQRTMVKRAQSSMK